jgi:hypothetical protein
MKIWKYSGIFLLATGALHTIVALLMGADEFIGMIHDGFINSAGGDNAARGLAFWFFVTGIVAFGSIGCGMPDYPRFRVLAFYTAGAYNHCCKQEKR